MGEKPDFKAFKMGSKSGSQTGCKEMSAKNASNSSNTSKVVFVATATPKTHDTRLVFDGKDWMQWMNKHCNVSDSKEADGKSELDNVAEGARKIVEGAEWKADPHATYAKLKKERGDEEDFQTPDDDILTLLGEMVKTFPKPAALVAQEEQNLRNRAVKYRARLLERADKIQASIANKSHKITEELISQSISSEEED